MTFNASTRESTDKIQTPTSFEWSRNTSSGAFMVNSRSNRIEEIKFQNCASKRFLPPRVFSATFITYAQTFWDIRQSRHNSQNEDSWRTACPASCRVS